MSKVSRLTDVYVTYLGIYIDALLNINCWNLNMLNVEIYLDKL